MAAVSRWLVGRLWGAGVRVRLAAAAALVSVVWVVALVGAPYFAGRAVGGRPGLVAVAAVYAVGGLLCHQRPDRSFRPWGVPMPVCARCFGLYAAAPLGAVAAAAVAAARVRSRRRRLTARGARRLLVAAAVPTAAVWLVEWLGLAAPSGAVRAVLALPLGAAAGWVLARAIAEEIE